VTKSGCVCCADDDHQRNHQQSVSASTQGRNGTKSHADHPKRQRYPDCIDLTAESEEDIQKQVRDTNENVPLNLVVVKQRTEATVNKEQAQLSSEDEDDCVIVTPPSTVTYPVNRKKQIRPFSSEDRNENKPAKRGRNKTTLLSALLKEERIPAPMTDSDDSFWAVSSKSHSKSSLRAYLRKRKLLSITPYPGLGNKKSRVLSDV